MESRKKSRSRSRSNSLHKEKKPANSITSSNKKDSNYPQCPEKGSFKIIHWNINGLRPLLKTKELDNLIKNESPDMFCFNETKIDDELVQKMAYNTLFKSQYKS